MEPATIWEFLVDKLPGGMGNPTVLDMQITPESVPQGATFDVEATGTVE